MSAVSVRESGEQRNIKAMIIILYGFVSRFGLVVRR